MKSAISYITLELHKLQGSADIQYMIYLSLEELENVVTHSAAAHLSNLGLSRQGETLLKVVSQSSFDNF